MIVTQKHKFKRLKRQNEVAKCYLRGMTQCEIAEKLNVSQSLVSSDIAAIHKRWVAKQITDRGAKVQVELEKLSQLEASAWEQWERSKQKKERVTKRSGTSVRGQFLEAGLVSEDQCGDPRYLTIIGNCIGQRCKILGLETAPKTNGLDPSEIIRRMAPVLVEEFKLLGLDRASVAAILGQLDKVFDASNTGAPVAVIERPRGDDHDDVVDVDVEL
jgi:transposase